MLQSDSPACTPWPESWPRNAGALEAGHAHTRTLLDAAAAMLGEIDRRGWQQDTAA